MDFEGAALRLEKDQSKIRGRRDKAIVSVKAKKEAEYRKRQQQLAKEKRERQQVQLRFVEKYFTDSNRCLGVRQLAPNGLFLKATSIHGDGDKIALPPSVLEHLTTSDSGDDQQSASPWMFRVGILNPEYKFPASIALQEMKPPDEDDDDNYDDMEDDEDGARSDYLAELSEKYISYSHATVVEFTQDEDHVGLPSSIAAALLHGKGESVATTRTKDPAGSSDDDDDGMEKTPGHLAWGAFDVPNVSIEISMVKLPKGRGCTLVPTMDAIRNGFHKLKDVKLVLEQSLIRTRATLSMGDVVHTWHRGTKYDLTVTSLTPASFHAVSCINTDIEVDIGANEEMEEFMNPEPSATAEPDAAGRTLGGGRTLSNDSLSDAMVSTPMETSQPAADLLPEPPVDQKEGVCTVQIRADNGTGRRRFDVNVATLGDMWAFASSCTNAVSFHLVTRFPRRVISLGNGDHSLASAGFAAGQEILMVEKL